jgi:dynein heavy chain, axonemal
MTKLNVIEDEIMQLELGNEVNRQYMSIARQVMTYEKILLKQWTANVDSIAMNYLKMNILSRDPNTGKIIVSFNKGLVKLMRETRYLDRMCLEIPEIPLNVTLQEESYSKYVCLMCSA